jgi:GIY-YIG catalytic domain
MFTVYAIRCEATQQRYVGITGGKLAKRYREHKCLAKSGKHNSPKLVEAWKLYGDDQMKAEVLETFIYDMTLGQKREAELKWLNYFDSHGLLLNAAIISFAPTQEAIKKGIEAARAITGNRWTPEANRKRSEAQKGKPKNHGWKISATKQAQKAAKALMK